jgi:hypothetical protein
VKVPLDERTTVVVGPLANRALILGGVFLRRSTFVPPTALKALAVGDQICGNPSFGDVPLGIGDFIVEHAGAPTTAAAAATFTIHPALR